MITPLCFQKLQLLQNFAPRIIAAEPRRAKGMTKSVRYEVSLYLGSFSYIFSTTRVKKIVCYTDDSVISGFVISRFHCNQKKKMLSWPLVQPPLRWYSKFYMALLQVWSRSRKKFNLRSDRLRESSIKNSLWVRRKMVITPAGISPKRGNPEREAL